MNFPAIMKQGPGNQMWQFIASVDDPLASHNTFNKAGHGGQSAENHSVAS